MQLSVALQGVMTQQLLPTADGSGRVVALRGARARRPAVRNLIREGKTHQIYSVHADRRRRRHADDGRRARRRSCAQGKITQRLAEARSSTPDELRRLLGVGGLGSMAA